MKLIPIVFMLESLICLYYDVGLYYLYIPLTILSYIFIYKLKTKKNKWTKK
jgi:hypothetical protein